MNKGCDATVPKKRHIKPAGDITDQFRVGRSLFLHLLLVVCSNWPCLVGTLAQNVSAIRRQLTELIREPHYPHNFVIIVIIMNFLATQT